MGGRERRPGVLTQPFMKLLRGLALAPDADERSRTARAAAALLLLGATAGILLLPILPPHIDRGLALTQALLCFAVGLVIPVLPWARWPRIALVAPIGLVVPVVFLGGGLLDGAIDYYALFLPLAFIYMGLAFRPMSSLYLCGVCLVGLSIAMLREQRPDVLPAVLLGLVLSTVCGVVLARQRGAEQETYRSMQRLVAAATTLGAARSPDEVARLVADAAADLLEADGVAVLLRVGPTGDLRVAVEWTRPLPGSDEDLLRPELAVLVEDAVAALGLVERGHLPLSRDGREVGTAFALRGDGEIVGAVVALRAVGGRMPAGTAARTVGGLAAEAARVLQRLLVAEDLRRSATTDRLTGLGNRAALEEAVNSALPGDVVALIDLDHFKTVNDTLGHAAGDDVLRSFGAVLLQTAGPTHMAARYGGEEFVVLMRDSDERTAAAHMQRLREQWAGSGAQVTFSSGIAVVDRDEEPTQTLVRADVAMYQAKRAGRDRDVVAPPIGRLGDGRRARALGIGSRQ